MRARIRTFTCILRVCAAVTVWYVLVLADASQSTAPITIDYSTLADIEAHP